MDVLASALDNFSNKLRLHVADEKTAIANARLNVQQYHYSEYKYLWHYAELIRASVSATDLRDAAIAMQDALTGINGAVIYSQHGSFATTNSHGLSIYLDPPQSYRPSYANMALSRVDHWDEFIQEQRQ